MSESGMARVRLVLTAIKQAEMMRLAQVRQASAQALAEAATLRQSSAAQQPSDTASDMLSTAAWQTHAELKARAAEARSHRIEAAAEPLKQALARTIGRESAVERAITEEKAQQDQLQARRAEGA